jgi:prophage DNA circulation protein
MSWRDRFRPGGSFRGAAFLIEADSLAFGRRVELHEFPRRDTPWAEDLGRRAREFTLNVYVLGPDYDRDRDALIAAIEQPGPGTLVHPYHGTMQVTVVRASKSESTREGGLCRFALTLVESGALRFPERVTDTAAAVVAAADTAEAAALADFTAVYDVAGQAQYFVDQVQADLDAALRAVDARLGLVAGAAAAVIRTPANLAGALVDGLAGLAETLAEPAEALALYEGLFRVGADAQPVPLTTASRRRQATNTEALHALLRRAGVSGACRTASRIEYAAAEDALAVRDRLVAGLDAQLEAVGTVDARPIADAVYQPLAALRAVTARDLAERGAELPRVSAYTPPVTLPLLVIAHQVYGEATRAAEIGARNRPRHPGFVPGGVALEVLRDD